MPRKLGILAGGGRLPKRLIDACRAAGRPHVVIAFIGQADPTTVDGEQTIWLRLGAGAAILRTLEGSSVEDVVLAGSIHRPGWRQLRPDLWSMGFLLRTGALSKGDDGLLRELIKVFEARGMSVVGADAIAPDLLTPAGCLTRREPTAAEHANIDIAATAARELGRADRGQAVVVSGGEVIAREGPQGTDAMLSGLTATASGGVLVKCVKPEQDLRVDLPSAGPDTVINAHARGVAGIALEAGRSLMIDRTDMIAEANRLGMFVVGLKHEGQGHG